MATRTVSRILTLLILSSICSGIVAGTDARNNSLDFVNPPSSGEIIGGTYSVAIVNITGLDYVILEVEEGTTWTQISNMSGSPWSTSWDTSTVAEGNHRLRITGLLTGVLTFKLSLLHFLLITLPHLL